MTDDQSAEWKILALASKKGKFAIQLGTDLDQTRQHPAWPT